MTTTTENPLAAKVRARLDAERKELVDSAERLSEDLPAAQAHYDASIEKADAAYAAAGEHPSAGKLAELARLDDRIWDAQVSLMSKLDAVRRVQDSIEEIDRPSTFERRLAAAEAAAERFAYLQENHPKRKALPTEKRATVREAIDKVLAEADEPLHYREITKRIIDRGLATLRGQTPGATVNAACSVAAKNGDGIVKTAPGTFKAA